MKESFYFQHDYNAANDVKVLYLRQQLGIEGYGIFWFVIEQLAQAGGRLPLKVIPVIAMQIQTTIDKVASVIKNYELFEIENEEFFSIRLIQQLEFRKQLSIEGKKGAEAKWAKYRQKKAENSPSNAPPNSPPYAKERKEKESKGEEIYSSANEAFEEWKNDDTLIEDIRLTIRGYYASATPADIGKIMRKFLLTVKSSGKIENSTKSEMKHYLMNWINSKGSKIHEYAK